MSSRCAASSSTACGARFEAPVFRACSRTRAFQSWRAFMMISRKGDRSLFLCPILGKVKRPVPFFRLGPLGVFDAGHLAERRDEPAPVFALLRQDAPAGLRDPVVTAAALAGLF